MARKEAATIELNAFERKWLTELSKSRTAPHAIVQRARILLLAADKVANTHIVKQLGTGKKTVQRWRKRWLSAQAKLRALQASGKAEKDIISEIRAILQDAPRPGTPPTFIEAQIMQIQKLACEDPTKSGRELSQWSLTALADEAVKRGIVETISPASVQRFLKEANIQPHKSRYRLNSETKNKDPHGFKALIQEICNLYHLCVLLLTLRIHIVSVDEMTGIQALERIYADKPVLPGKSRKQEFGYKRHGTLSLIAFLDVATGKIVAPYINKTRTEEDFLAAVRAAVELNPADDWMFICDCLNTHKSESLVRFVAEHDKLEIELGVKGEWGILKNMESRAAFLGDLSHSIRFVYTPKHSSWVNQIEIWFGILNRKLLKRMSYDSTAALKASINRFIDRYNITAHPFKWKYTGNAL